MNVVAFAGGVGGAKLAHGLAQVLPARHLTVVVNTGDDFEHFGLKISPDLDTVCYTLAGLANPVTGWGRIAETWHVLDGLKRLNAPGWFNLGDQDLATHLERTRLMQSGVCLSEITARFCAAWDVAVRVLPMTDDPVKTCVDTVELGWLEFQSYFVEHHCEPQVRSFKFEGVETARPAEGVLQAIEGADLVVFCPSNPWVSIDPILALHGIRAGLAGKKVAAVSPIVGGKAIKGPAAKMYRELGIEPSALAVARHYRGLVDHFVMDQVDAEAVHQVEETGARVLVTDTVMKSDSDRARLAAEILAFAQTSAGG